MTDQVSPLPPGALERRVREATEAINAKLSESDRALAEALAELQTQLPDIPKASKAQYGAYANLADVSKKLLPIMGSLGLSFTTRPTWIVRDDGTGQFVLAYSLRHIKGGRIDGEYPLGSGTHQALGSAITYGRRYCLCAITGAVAEDDDDGQLASGGAAAASKRGAREKPPIRPLDELPRNRDGSLSRSRCTEEELAHYGAMDSAQQKQHNALERDVLGTDSQGKVKTPQAQHLTETPPEEPWEQPPPAPLRTPHAAPPKAGLIHQHFGRLKFTDDDRIERLGAMTIITGRRITSTNDLTAAEGIAVEKFIAACRDRDVLTDKLLDRLFMEPDDKRAVLEWRGDKVISFVAGFLTNAGGDVEQARSDLWGRYRIHNKMAGIDG